MKITEIEFETLKQWIHGFEFPSVEIRSIAIKNERYSIVLLGFIFYSYWK